MRKGLVKIVAWQRKHLHGTRFMLVLAFVVGVLTALAGYPAVQNAFAGIRVCVCVLIFNAVCRLWKSITVPTNCWI